MNDDLIKKAKQIIEELGREHQDSLKEWMAHYIAELMEKALSEDVREAQEAEKECAQIILKLWEMKIQEQIIQVKHEVNSWRNQIHEEDAKYYEKLKHALANPENSEPFQNAEDGVTIQLLSEVERWLLELFWITEVLNEPNKELIEETTLRMAKSEAETRTTCQRVAKIFPDLADLDLTDQNATDEKITQALRSVDRLRHALLWEEEQ
jgi:glucan-binding YG repeat protein